MRSAMPSISRVQTARVASGVTSRSAILCRGGRDQAGVSSEADDCFFNRRLIVGPQVAEILRRNIFVIDSHTEICPTISLRIEEAIVRLAGNARLVATTGGTGIAERDVTPEATRAVCTRLNEGIAERNAIRRFQKDADGSLSRAV